MMDIGGTIRTIRKRKNITIPQLCEATGLSKGFISNVETNKTSPSIATLQSIAEALQVPLSYFLLKQEERMQVIRKDERKRKPFGDSNVQIQYLTTQGPLRVIIVESNPGDGNEPHAHVGYEFHLVLKGTYLAGHGEDTAVVTEGDAFSWNASVPHWAKNIGDGPGALLIASYNELKKPIV